MRKTVTALLAAGLALVAIAGNAEPVSPAMTGPVIKDFGPYYPVPTPGFPTDTDMDYRVVFDVARSDQDAASVNPRIATAARFLNMHTANRVDPSRIHLAVVVHGAAAEDLLGDTAYRQRNGIDNPNTPLIAQLAAAGVDIIVCGQTAAHRGFTQTMFNEKVLLALSAMTALVTLQNRGYALIQF